MEYLYVGDTLVSQKTGNETINFAYTASGAPLGFTYNGTPYYYMLNLQGDIVAIYDSTGTIVAEYVYDAWGKLISISGSMADTIGVKNPLRYRGYYYDTETGFYYLQSRYYDSETSRFINADAYLIAGDDLIQGTNMYAYCYNNPVYYLDSTGCEPLPYWQMLQIMNILIDFISILQKLIVAIQKLIPIDITENLNNEMRNNAQTLIEYREAHGYIKTVEFFVNKVKPGGDWDFKSQDDWALDSSKKYLYNGIELRYDDIGNIHYGYVGRVLFSESVLLIAGGGIQIIAGTSSWEYWQSNFDDPRDQWAISFGCDLWDSGGV